MPKSGCFVNGNDMFEDDDITEVEQLYCGVEKVVCPYCGLRFIADTYAENVECELCSRIIDS